MLDLDLNNEEKLLTAWWWSAGQMHIAHHLAAAKYARDRIIVGFIALALSATVSSTLFISLREGSQANGDQQTYLIIGLISLASSIVGVIYAFLNFDQRINQHFKSATAFQHLRRLIEEELMRYQKGQSKENYDFIRDSWTDALEAALPLPQKSYKRAGKQLQEEYERHLKKS